MLATRGVLIALGLIVILSGTPSPSGPRSVPHDSGVLQSALVSHPPPVVLGAAAPLNTTLSVSNSSVNLSSLFWGTNINNEVHMFRGESDAVNATPARVLVWPGAMAGEDYDPLTNTHYNTYYGTPSRALTSEAQFVQMCKATHCSAIMQVPAEIDDANFAEKIVNYTEKNLSFIPAYWMLGNEPELWQHWKVPWKNWPTQYTVGPTPTQFGNEVLDYVKAIRNVDNTTPILGLPASGCTCGSWPFDQWIAGVLKVTGDKIQAVAFHEYPAGWLGTGDGSLGAFYGTIQGPASIPVRMIAARQAVNTACPGCNVSVWISELGAALSWSTYGPYAIGFSGALSIASQITQGMNDNLTNIDLFATELATTNSWFDPHGNARPDYTLYTQIFDHLGSEAFPVNFTGLGHSIYGIDTITAGDQGRRDLLVVNDNISHAISFSPKFAESASSAAVEAWSWNGSIHSTSANHTTWVEPFTTNPVDHEFPDGLPARYTLPPQAMVLFEEYPSGGTYVRVSESGVPSPTAWYASVGSRFYQTTAGNFSLLLPPGSFPIGSVGVPLPIGGKELNPSERLGPVVSSPLQVGGRYTNTTIDFVAQWRLNITASPSEGGTIRGGADWWNASEPLNLTAAPAAGYAFVGWSGFGPGSYNGTARSITIVPAGRVLEKARFVVGDEVDLVEEGLPTGTPWSVTIRGLSTNSSSNLVALFEAPGTYGFTVNPVPGYRSLPRNGGFTANTAWSWVLVHFVPITPPPPVFGVTFQISGLPSSTPVSIIVRDATQLLGGRSPPFQLMNGSYAYHVGYVPGYHCEILNKTFAVHGGPVTVEVPFVPTVYRATWEAVGARSWMNWSVRLDGAPIVANSSWISAWLPNGSYPYTIQLPSNFSASPPTGVIEVAGFDSYVYPSFSLLQFPAEFRASGAGGSAPWSVRMGNLTQWASTNRSSFMAANGTYTFDVHPPPGYYAVPSHGNVTVAGPTSGVEIQFLPSSNRPSAALAAELSAGALTVSLWIGGAFVVGYAGLRRLRRRGG